MPAKRPETTDAITLLRKDHAAALKLLREFESTTTDEVDRRKSLLDEVATAVEVHAQIEEEIFYPAFRQEAEEGEDMKLFYEAAEEHKLVKQLLPMLQRTDPRREQFSARAKVLKDLV